MSKQDIVFLCVLLVYSSMYILFASGVRSLQDEIVSEYKKLCPHTDICNARGTGYTPNLGGDTTLLPCCSSCRCDKDCGQDCCPDKSAIEIKLPLPERDTLQACITAHYSDQAGVMQQGDSYVMISKCPYAFEDTTIKDDCMRKYSDFSILETLNNFPPVMTNTSRLTYKNRICAFCNDELEENLIYWKMKFVCQSDPLIFPSSTADIFRIVEDSDNCNIVFEPPTNAEVYSKGCEVRIDRCNVTGKWEKYDDTTAKACNSYTSLYTNAYKNVHCFLCNGHTEVNVSPICEYERPSVGPNSFVALLDFNQLEKQKLPNSQNRCPVDQVFDPMKEKCLPLHCGHGFRLEENKCTPLYLSVAGYRTEVVYGVTLILVPTLSSSTQVLNLERFKDILIQTINGTLEVFNLRPCVMYSFIKIKTSVRRLITELYASNRTISLSDIEYIPLNIRIGESNVDNVSRTIENVVDFFKINVNDFDVVLHKIPESMFIRATTALVTYTSLRTRAERAMLSSLKQSFTEFLSFDGGYDYYGKGILPLIREPKERVACTLSFSVDTTPFCPKVELSVADYDISFYHNTIQIVKTKTILPANMTMLSENGSHLYICSEYFINAFGMQTFNDDSEFAHTPLSILTIMFNSLSLLALVVTLIVYCVFPDLRTLPGLNNMGLVISLIFVFSLSLVNALVDILTVRLCRVVGISLHLALLSSFGWMFVCTLHMARVFATISERAVQRSILKQFLHYVLLAEIPSAAIVIVTVLVGYFRSDGDNIGYVDEPCYTAPDMLVYNVAIPVGIVIILNFTMFFYVILTISRMPDLHKNSSHERHNIAIFAKLSTLTGLTWSFAFIYQFTDINAFAYISTVVNASQGIFIMFSFVANKRIYNMIRTKQRNISSETKETKIPTVSKCDMVGHDTKEA